MEWKEKCEEEEMISSMLTLYYKMSLGLDGYIAIFEWAVNGLAMMPINWKVRQQERKPSKVIAIDLSDRT